jgi:hypothetical protein
MRALRLIQEQGPFDCLYCVLADAKSSLDRESGQGDVWESIEMLRQHIVDKVELLPSDAPLVDATAALRPYLNEIAGCPSPMSGERMREVLEEVLGQETAIVGQARS